MARLIGLLTTLLRIATGLSFMVMIIAVIIQLLGRSGVIPTMIWTEELSRFALIWLAALGVGLALNSGDLVNVDLVCEALPGRGPWILRLTAAAITAAFCFILIPGAMLYTSIGVRQTAPALGIHMTWSFAATIVAFVTLGGFATLRVIAMLMGVENGLPNRQTEEL
jgi:TRAP-type transport system small permease protein